MLLYLYSQRKIDKVFNNNPQGSRLRELPKKKKKMVELCK